MKCLNLELLINITNSGEKTIDNEVKNLLDEIQKVVNSVKEYYK
jgi:hypothetical protein